MIKITELKTFIDEMLVEITGFAGYILVSDEDHMVNRLKDKSGVQLGVVYPSGTRQGNQNSPVDQNSTLFFILEKGSAGQTEEKEIAQYQKLQDLAQKTIAYVDDQASEGCSLVERYDPAGTTIDPEYNIGGFNGWSISLVF